MNILNLFSTDEQKKLLRKWGFTVTPVTRTGRKSDRNDVTFYDLVVDGVLKKGMPVHEPLLESEKHQWLAQAFEKELGKRFKAFLLEKVL